MESVLDTYIDCSRCKGTGRIVGYSNVKGGICFSCDGKARRKLYIVVKDSFYALPRSVEDDLSRLGFVQGYKMRKLVGKKYKDLGYIANCGHGTWLSYSKNTGEKVYGADSVREAAELSGLV